jgi:nitroimidazol reductase NimA-like FMN-containing flavoprotein (pyridoxamine 5'-phosphate oxidase superfamily)
MVGDLGTGEIERVLRENIIGRIGVYAFGRTYIVPITYIYDGRSIYAHSKDGMKMHMMRENPHVCFEVDHVDGLANWESVSAPGTFEELHGEQAGRALEMLTSRLAPRLKGPPGASAHPRAGMTPSLIYRIALEEKTGRFEKRT